MVNKYAELVESKVLDVEDNFNCEEAQLSLSYRVSLSVESKARRGLNQGQYFGVSESTSILDNVSGICELGQMLAVMGPSGAGKTSLLNCLSLRNTRFRGYVLHSGEPPDLDSLAVNTVFVQQEELFIGQVTPREHLTFNATLRASKPMSKNQRREIVNKSLEEMGLVECADIPIGGKGIMIRGLSGGQKRRLSFATEMMGDPKIVFADEPTSGLDSHMALMLVSKMKGIVDRGKLVVATIHQPSSQVFGLFTHLHLLVEGRTVYFGPQTGVVNYLDQIGYPCPDFFNPADFFMSVLGRNTGHGRVAENLHLTGNQRNTAALSSTPTPTPTSTCESRVRSLLQAFEMSEEAATVLRGLPLENDLMNSLGAPKERTSNQPQTYQVSWIKQTAEVYLRTVKVIVRSELWKIFMSVALGAFFGLLFFHLGTSQEDVQGIMGFLFFALMTIGNRSFFTTAQVFTLETRHLLHEYDSGLYSMSAYFVGRTLAELPVQILFPTIFTTITGILTQVTRSTTTFLLYLLITILLENAYASIG